MCGISVKQMACAITTVKIDSIAKKYGCEHSEVETVYNKWVNAGSYSEAECWILTDWTFATT